MNIYSKMVLDFFINKSKYSYCINIGNGKKNTERILSFVKNVLVFANF